MLIPSSSVNTTPELRIFILTGSLRFFRRFPQINVGGDSAHLSSFGKRTREPRPRSPAKGTLRQMATPLGSFLFLSPSLLLLHFVATCPLRASEGEAHGWAFQRRKDAWSHHQRLFVENVEQNRRKPVKMKILSSGVVFTLEEGISTSHVCLKGQQPIF